MHRWRGVETIDVVLPGARGHGGVPGGAHGRRRRGRGPERGPRDHAVVLDISGEVESIDGYIDDQRRDALNPDLSRRRAESVAAVLGPLVAAGDIPLVTQGLGEDHPRVVNQDADGNPMPENQRRNRRVEFTPTT